MFMKITNTIPLFRVNYDPNDDLCKEKLLSLQYNFIYVAAENIPYFYYLLFYVLNHNHLVTHLQVYICKTINKYYHILAISLFPVCLHA